MASDAFLTASKTRLISYTCVDKRLSDDQKNSALKKIIDNAIVTEGVDDIFKLVNLDKPNIGLLTPEFMEDVASLKEKNVAVELLVIVGVVIRSSDRLPVFL